MQELQSHLLVCKLCIVGQLLLTSRFQLIPNALHRREIQLVGGNIVTSGEDVRGVLRVLEAPALLGDDIGTLENVGVDVGGEDLQIRPDRHVAASHRLAISDLGVLGGNAGLRLTVDELAELVDVLVLIDHGHIEIPLMGGLTDRHRLGVVAGILVDLSRLDLLDDREHVVGSGHVILLVRVVTNSTVD